VTAPPAAAKLRRMWVCEECGQRYGQAGHCTTDGKPLVAVDDPLLGEVIGNYRITRLLGAGGMGRVYAAVQPAIHARVAIKVLSLDTSQNRDLVDRFFSEARAVNLIRHENIVNVTDLARLPDGRPYIVMEYLDGSPLSGVLRKRGPMPLGSTVQLMSEVLDALAAAHAKGIVHRDLKPDNIFVTPGGRAKVLDFGIAKLAPELSGMSAPTRANAIMGTPPYMSPEQAAGKVVDTRSDLYSIGVILYEMVTGGLPFVSESLFDILRMHIMEPPPPPRARRGDLPPAMEHVILAALAKDPAQRPQTAQDLAGMLQQAAQALPPEQWQSLRLTGGVMPPAHMTGRGFQSTAPAPGPAGPSTQPRGKSKTPLIAGGVALAAVAGVVIFLLASGGGKAHKPDPTDSPTPSAGQSPTPTGVRPSPPVVVNPTPTPTDSALPFDGKHLDVMEVARAAVAEANRRGGTDDFQIVEINVHNVNPEGISDLTIGKDVIFMVDVASKKLAVRPSNLPKGVPFEPQCGFRIYYWPTRGWDFRGPDECELEEVIEPIHCTPKRVWQMALGAGAPRDAVAWMVAQKWSDDPPGWTLRIGEEFSFEVADADCK